MSVSIDYYGIGITTVQKSDRWKWKVILPTGVTITSTESYDTPDQALFHGERWVSIETAFTALNTALSELSGEGVLQKREYGNLMESFVNLTH